MCSFNTNEPEAIFVDFVSYCFVWALFSLTGLMLINYGSSDVFLWSWFVCVFIVIFFLF